MSQWRSAKAKLVLKALQRNGWQIVSEKGSHKKLQHPDHGSYMFSFHDNEEIGPKMLSKIAKGTGLKPEHL